MCPNCTRVCICCRTPVTHYTTQIFLASSLLLEPAYSSWTFHSLCFFLRWSRYNFILEKDVRWYHSWSRRARGGKVSVPSTEVTFFRWSSTPSPQKPNCDSLRAFQQFGKNHVSKNNTFGNLMNISLLQKGIFKRISVTSGSLKFQTFREAMRSSSLEWSTAQLSFRELGVAI